MSGERLEATVVGVVQGVGFRVFVLDRARALGLTGRVSNTARGAVECIAEGDRLALEQLLEDLRRGPAAALVEDVRAGWLPATGTFTGFAIGSARHAGD